MESVFLASSVWLGVNDLSAGLLATAAIVSVGMWFQSQLAPVADASEEDLVSGKGGSLATVLEQIDDEIEVKEQQLKALKKRRDAQATAIQQLTAKAPDSPMLGRSSKDLPVMSKTDVEKHNTADDCWVIVEDKVYDLTRWLAKHPGGSQPILARAGLDCTDVFVAFHPPEIRRKINCRVVGRLDQPGADQLSKDYRALHEELVQRGFNEVMPLWHYGRTLVISSLLGISVTLVVLYQDRPLVQFVGAVALAAFWQQLAFVGHDLGHNSVTHNRRTDYLYGLAIGPLLTGISIGWWKNSHNTHHVATNHLEHDPDVQHMPFMAISERLASGKLFSTYHKKLMELDLLGKVMIPLQHYLYFPIMFFARFFLYVQSIIYLVSKKSVEHRMKELLGMGLFALWVGTLSSYVHGPWMRLGWLLLAHGAAGILHVQITLSHFCMDTHDNAEGDSIHKDSFVRSQCATSLDIECPPWMDFFHGGLQFQVIHHLFPRVPRYRLRELRPLVLDLCSKHGIKYHSCGFLEGNQRTIQTLKAASERSQLLHFPMG